MSSWTGLALIGVIITRLGSHQLAQRLQNRENSQSCLTPHPLFLTHALCLCVEKPSHDADHFKHKGEWQMKAESDHDKNGGLSIYGSLTRTAASLYTPSHVLPLFKVYGNTIYGLHQAHLNTDDASFYFTQYTVQIRSQYQSIIKHVLYINCPSNKTKCTICIKKTRQKTTLNLACK